MKVKKEQLKLDMEQWTGSELGKEYVKPVCLTSMQNTSCGMLGWMSYKLDLRLLGETTNVRYADDTTLIAESEEELKSLLMRVKEENGKSQLKTQHPKNFDS